MLYRGPKLDPVVESVSIWNWLFSHKTSSNEKAISPRQNGFHEAKSDLCISFQDLELQATYCASALSALHGLQPRQTVAILAKNSIVYAVAVYAAGRLGAVVTALPSMAMADDIAYYLKASNSQIVFYDKSTAREVKRAWKGPGAPHYKLFSLNAEAEDTGHYTLQKLIREGHARGRHAQVPAWTIPPGESNKNICAFLAFSSGTTGRPKAVMISHANMIAQCTQMRTFYPAHPGPLLALLPFYHITGLVQLLHLPLLLDQEVVVMGDFDMTSMLDTIVKYRCEELWLVPPLLIRLVSDPAARNYDLSFVRQFNTGAAPLPPQIIDKLAGLYPTVALRQAWGMTESTSCLTVTPPGMTTYANAAKVGKLVPGAELKIIDIATGAEKGPGEEGELWARSPQVTMGYLNDPDETRKTFDADGFLHTGDLGAIDREGFVTIYDRLKEMIKVRGHGVAPAELEDALLSHPKVVDAAVIGIPHDYSGEVPKAYVATKSGVVHNEDTADELKQHIKGLKPRYMHLAGGIEFVLEIPKSAAGKILRKVLKARHKEQAANDVKSKL